MCAGGMRRVKVPVWFTLSVSGVWGGCATPESAELEPRLSVLETEIFGKRCSLSSCHGGPGPVRGLELEPGHAYDSLVNVESFDGESIRVVPGDPDSSLLVQVLEGPVGTIRRMPVGGMLDDDELTAIREWIELGANRD